MEDIRKRIEDIIDWSGDISELWTGTLYEGIVDGYEGRITKFMESGDWEAAESEAGELAQLLNEAEVAYGE